MIVVLSFYSDGSDRGPGLKFFPVNREQSRLLAAHLIDCMGTGKDVEVYELTSVNEEARQICISGSQPNL
jgi:hypothetical protein